MSDSARYGSNGRPVILAAAG